VSGRGALSVRIRSVIRLFRKLRQHPLRMLGAGLFQKEEVSGMRGPLPAPATAGDVSGDGRMRVGTESASGPIDTCLLSEPGFSWLIFIPGETGRRAEA